MSFNSLHLNGRSTRLSFIDQTNLPHVCNYTRWKHCSIGFYSRTFFTVAAVTAPEMFVFYIINLLIWKSFTCLVIFFFIILNLIKYNFLGSTANWFASSHEGLRNVKTPLLAQFAKDDNVSLYSRIILASLNVLEVVFLMLDMDRSLSSWLRFLRCQGLNFVIHKVNFYNSKR